MLSTLLAVGWEPEIRGALTVIIGVVALMGSVYLLLGTNLGARLGFLVALAGLFGWMATMGAIWWTYGIGLKGREPSWKPAAPISIVRDARLLDRAEVIGAPIKIDAGAAPTEVAKAAQAALVDEGWTRLDDADPRRGQAVASADDIIQNRAKEYAAGEYTAVSVYDSGGERWPKVSDSLDFTAFFHKPRYALVELASLVPQRTEPGRAPARPVIDESQPHRYLLMIRDLGSKRQPAVFITIGSTIIFLILCWLLHRRDRFLQENVAGELNPAKV
ncbi:MAG: hypothetical protein KJS66_02340 [Acidobacteria bacterium]|nr:hypothetical protein [Acidobacteriota bacterium]